MIAAVAGQRPISAALGELVSIIPGRMPPLLSVEGIEVVKLGLAGCADLEDWSARWIAVQETAISQQKQLAAVIYADWREAQAPSPASVFAFAREQRVNYLLIDTWDKLAGSLFEHFSLEALQRILSSSTAAGISTILAGSLNLAQVPRVAGLEPKMVGVRGAVCSESRTGLVDQQSVQAFRRAIDSMILATAR
jgi:uncharacterized protein (UPF0264 family)